MSPRFPAGPELLGGADVKRLDPRFFGSVSHDIRANPCAKCNHQRIYSVDFPTGFTGDSEAFMKLDRRTIDGKIANTKCISIVVAPNNEGSLSTRVVYHGMPIFDGHWRFRARRSRRRSGLATGISPLPTSGDRYRIGAEMTFKRKPVGFAKELPV